MSKEKELRGIGKPPKPNDGGPRSAPPVPGPHGAKPDKLSQPPKEKKS